MEPIVAIVLGVVIASGIGYIIIATTKEIKRRQRARLQKKIYHNLRS